MSKAVFTVLNGGAGRGAERNLRYYVGFNEVSEATRLR